MASTKEQISTEEQINEVAIRFKKWEIVANVVQLGIPSTSLVIIVGLVAYMVSQLSGKTTLAQIGMSFIGNINVSNAVAYIFGAASFGYGLNERRLRHKKTASMAEYAASLEKRIHPERTSSGLTRQGTTRKEDKL